MTLDGKLFSWGANASGQLGLGNTTTASLPTQVSLLGTVGGTTAPVDVSAVAVGATHVLALAANGQLFAWGANANGQLGTGGTTTATLPVPVLMGAMAGKTVIAIVSTVNTADSKTIQSTIIKTYITSIVPAFAAAFFATYITAYDATIDTSFLSAIISTN